MIHRQVDLLAALSIYRDVTPAAIDRWAKAQQITVLTNSLQVAAPNRFELESGAAIAIHYIDDVRKLARGYSWAGTAVALAPSTRLETALLRACGGWANFQRLMNAVNQLKDVDISTIKRLYAEGAATSWIGGKINAPAFNAFISRQPALAGSVRSFFEETNKIGVFGFFASIMALGTAMAKVIVTPPKNDWERLAAFEAFAASFVEIPAAGQFLAYLGIADLQKTGLSLSPGQHAADLWNMARRNSTKLASLIVANNEIGARAQLMRMGLTLPQSKAKFLELRVIAVKTVGQARQLVTVTDAVAGLVSEFMEGRLVGAPPAAADAIRGNAGEIQKLVREAWAESWTGPARSFNAQAFKTRLMIRSVPSNLADEFVKYLAPKAQNLRTLSNAEASAAAAEILKKQPPPSRIEIDAVRTQMGIKGSQLPVDVPINRRLAVSAMSQSLMDSPAFKSLRFSGSTKQMIASSLKLILRGAAPAFDIVGGIIGVALGAHHIQEGEKDQQSDKGRNWIYRYSW